MLSELMLPYRGRRENNLMIMLIMMMITKTCRGRICPCCNSMLIALSKKSLVYSLRKSNSLRTGRSPGFSFSKILDFPFLKFPAREKCHVLKCVYAKSKLTPFIKAQTRHVHELFCGFEHVGNHVHSSPLLVKSCSIFIVQFKMIPSL